MEKFQIRWERLPVPETSNKVFTKVYSNMQNEVWELTTKAFLAIGGYKKSEFPYWKTHDKHSIDFPGTHEECVKNLEALESNKELADKNMLNKMRARQRLLPKAYRSNPTISGKPILQLQDMALKVGIIIDWEIIKEENGI